MLTVLAAFNLYIHEDPDSAAECRVLGASQVALCIPLALFSFWFPFGALPNRDGSKVPLSIPPTVRPNRAGSKAPLSIAGPAW